MVAAISTVRVQPKLPTNGAASTSAGKTQTSDTKKPTQTLVNVKTTQSSVNVRTTQTSVNGKPVQTIVNSQSSQNGINGKSPQIGASSKPPQTKPNGQIPLNGVKGSTNGSSTRPTVPSAPIKAPVGINTPSKTPAVTAPPQGPISIPTQPSKPNGNVTVSKPPVQATTSLPAKPSSIIPAGKTAIRNDSAGKLSVTGLGAQLISSSTTPIAKVEPPRAPVLSTTQKAPTLTQATGGASLLAQQTTPQVAKPLPTIQVDATAPSQQTEHAGLWSKVMTAAKSSSVLDVGKVAMKNLGLASIGSDGSLIKLPLSKALSTSDDTVPVDQAAAPAALASDDATDAVAKAAAQPPTIPLSVEQPTDSTAPTAPTDQATVSIPAAVASVQNGDDPKIATPSGFVLSGDIKLFGNIDAERFVYQGTAKDGKSEMVTFVKEPVAIDDVFQNSGVSFGKVMLSKPSISYYNDTVEGHPPKGLWLDAGVLLGDISSDIASDATTLFGQDQTNQLLVTIGLGEFSNWSAALKPPTDLTIKAEIPKASGKLGKHLEFTSASVTLVATKSTTSTYTWDATFTGTVLFTAPSSIAPLHLDYTMKKNGTKYDLTLHMNKDEEWTTAMGVPGMNLTDVMISTAYDTAEKNSLKFDIVASVKSATWDLNVTGNFEDDEFELSAAMMHNCTWQNLDDMYHKMFSSPLQPTKHNITFSELTLNVSSKDRELKLKGKMSADDWLTDLICEIDISSKGFQLLAEVPEVHCHELTIKDAKVALFVGKQGDVDPSPKTPGTATFFKVEGVIQFHDIELDAAAYFDKEESELIWALYAQLKPADLAKPPSFSLSKLFSTGTRTDLELALEDFVVTASNSDKVGDLMPQDLQYQIKNGMHLFAKVDCPSAVTKALNINAATVTLQVDLAPENKRVSLNFDVPQQMKLKPGMASTDVAVGIDFSAAEPKLFIEAVIEVQFNGQPELSKFEFELTADMTEAELKGEMKTDWVNPFNLGPNVKIVGPVGLGVDIIYVSPIYPSGLSFWGGLEAGSFKGSAKFKVTTSPKEGVLIVNVENLGIKDIISFASMIIEHTIPQPQSNFIELEKLDLSVSTGASLDDKFYPAGVTFDADMQLFGESITIKADITKEQMHLYGEIKAFNLGPLTVAGNTGKNPTVDLVVSEKSQKLQVDGNIRLWDVDAGITIIGGLEPVDLDFDAQLAFGELLDFKLHAQAVGKIDNFKDLMKSDFTFSATLEQHILDYFMAHANTYILAAKKGAEEDVDSAKAKLESAQKSYNDYIAKQQAALDDAKMKWDRQNQSVIAATDAKKAQVKVQTTAKQAEVDAAKAKLDSFIQGLEKKLADCKATEAAEVAKAQSAVNSEKAKVDAEVNSKVDELQKAQASLAKSFGSADSALESARAKVQNAQNDLTGTQQKLDNAKSDLSHASFFNKPKYAAQIVGIGAELGAKEAALKIAQGILVAAEGVVNGVGYKIAHEAVNIAQTALNDAKKVADAALNDVNKALSETQKLQAGLVDAAEKSLEEAKKECDQSKAWDAAKGLLKAAMEAEATVIADAEKAVAGLASCVEKVAYDAACAALALAKAGNKEIELASKGLDLVKDMGDEVAAMSSWMIKNAGNIFNIHNVQLSGSLGQAAHSAPLKAHIDGVFCDAPVNFDIDFVPGKAEDMMKATFEKIMSEVKGNIGAFVKGEAGSILKKL